MMHRWRLWVFYVTTFHTSNATAVECMIVPHCITSQQAEKRGKESDDAMEKSCEDGDEAPISPTLPYPSPASSPHKRSPVKPTKKQETCKIQPFVLVSSFR